nr:hypothetical protein [uncultured Thiodictyon sp.]
MLRGQGGLVQVLAPAREVLLDAPGALRELGAGPDGVFLQVPTQVVGLNGTQGGGEAPTARARHLALTGPVRTGPRLVDQAGAGRGAAHARAQVLVAQVGEFQHQFLDRLGRRLRGRRHVGREAAAQGGQDGVECRVDAAGCTADRDIGGFGTEDLFQDPEPGAVERERDDRVVGRAAVALDLECMGQLVAHPLGLQGGGAHQDRIGRRRVDCLLDHGPQQVAAAQFAGVDPEVFAQIGERLLEAADQGIVGGAVGEKERRLGHEWVPESRGG